MRIYLLSPSPTDRGFPNLELKKVRPKMVDKVSPVVFAFPNSILDKIVSLKIDCILKILISSKVMWPKLHSF